jgi:putative ABC transport system substrate-binding protein
MNVKIPVLALGAMLFALSVSAEAQQAKKVHRIGFVSATSPGPPIDALRQGLKERGYVEGKNIIVEARFAEGRSERLPELVAEVLRLKVDVLVVSSTPTVLAAKRANTTVPVVFVGLNDPVGTGIVESLARPGGNFTGVTMGVGGVGFGGKWLELLKEAVPGVSHVAVLSNPANPANAPFVAEIQEAARALKVKIDVHDAGNAANLDRAFDSIGTSGTQGIIVTPDPFFSSNRAKLVQFAASKRLPAMYYIKLFVDAGGLMSYAASLEEYYRSAATYVDKILKGAKPADLPVEQPMKFEFIINLKAAKQIGLTIPQWTLTKADRVIR